MQITEASKVEGRNTAELRDGILDTKILLAGKEGSLNNFVVTYSRSVTEFTTPRHRHPFDQIRLPLEGHLEFGEGKKLPTGWVSYFPEGVYYGPQVRPVGLLQFMVQYGGASGNGYISGRQRARATEELNRTGKFENGVFTYVDESGKKHNQDSFEAVWEQGLGRKVVYPKPRYSDHITMNPGNFDWIDDETTPGVAYRWLGTFSERCARMGFIRVERGAVLTPGMGEVPEMIFLTKGAVNCDDQNYPLHTIFGFEAKEGPKPIKALEDSEFFCVQLPFF